MTKFLAIIIEYCKKKLTNLTVSKQNAYVNIKYFFRNHVGLSLIMLDLKVKDFFSPTQDIVISVYVSAGYNNSFQDINFGTQFSITITTYV